MIGREVLSDKTVTAIGKDRKCVSQVIESHNRTVSRWAEPESRYRVVESP